jgi:putative transposase
MSGSEPFREPGRQHPAPGVHVLLGRPTFVLLTVTSEGREPWLANARVQQLLHETWTEATAWLVSDYLIMPDHLHLFCAPHNLAFTIEQWITYWKRAYSRKHGRPEWRFQSRGWHHRLREQESYSDKWLYVQENPVRKNLVTRVEDWPYKGRVHDLRW